MSNPHIQIDDLTPRAAFTVGGTPLTAFAFVFPYFESGDLDVYVGDTLKTITNDYTVAGNPGTDAGFHGGTVTLLVAATNTTVTIVRRIAVERTTDFPNSGPLQIRALNTQLDKLTAMIQETSETAGSRSFRVSDSDPAPAVVPPVSVRKMQGAFFDVDGNLVPGALSASPVSAVMQPVVAASSLSLAKGLLDLDKIGVIPCTATYAQPSTIGQYTLTPTAEAPFVPAVLEEGMRFRFLAPQTAPTGLIQVTVSGTNAILWTLMGADRYSYASFYDVQQNGAYTIEVLDAGSGIFGIVSAPTPWNRSNVEHGSVVMGADLSPCTKLVLNSNNGGGLLVKNPLTGAFRMCRMNGQISQELFNNTAYVLGNPNQSLAPFTIYYVYVFNLSGNNVFDLHFDFYTVPPDSLDIGINGLTFNPTRTYVGVIYTGNFDIGLKNLGARPQMNIHSWFNPQLLHMQTGTITIAGINASMGWVDVLDAGIRYMSIAANFSPSYHCRVNYFNTVADSEAQLQMRYSGLAKIPSDPAGNTVNVDAIAPGTPSRATSPSANGWANMYSQWVSAQSDANLFVNPQVRVIGAGTATFEVDHACIAWH